MFKILIQNLIGYDLIIFLVATVNIVLFLRIQKGIKSIESEFKETKFLQNELLVNRLNLNPEAKLADRLLGVLNKFTSAKQDLDQISVFYVAITSIFPLLGILGTVIALLSLSDFTNDIVSINFSLALSSTFWGILFGAFSKFGEGFFSAKLDQYDKLYHEIRSNLLTLGVEHE